MKKLLTISTFIFLTGLFAGLFFSYGLSDENKTYLVELLVSGLSGSKSGFFRSFLTSFVTNVSLAAFMIASVITKKLRPLPLIMLLYKSFALGFSSGLIYVGQAMGRSENPFLLSLIKILPQNLLFVPGFILLATVAFIYSREALLKTKRPSREKKDLNKIIIVCFAAITAGCLIEAIVLAVPWP